MATRKTPIEPVKSEMSPNAMARSIRRLQARLDQVNAFNPATLDPSDPYATVRPLEADIETALSETFGHGTVEYHRFISASRFDWPIVMNGGIQHSEKVKYVAQDKQRSIQLLEAAINLLKERIEDAEESSETLERDSREPERETSARVFVVHGHDSEPKEAVARYLESLGLLPVILHEQPNKGRTIIEKFREEASDVGFAIVLITPDDQMPDGNMRARQNVILELGFFLGALGPSRVVAIVKDSVERPSDFDGVVYVPYDANWRVSIAKELDAADYSIDWNKVMRGR